MELVFLGTSCMIPTKERNHSAMLLTYRGENILIDCGEGTQKQFKIAGIKPTKITKILISHWHGDHCLGLPGLIQTIDKEGYNKTLEIYGPTGTKKKVESLLKIFSGDMNIDIEIKDVEKRRFFENNDFILEALELKHGIKTLGFAFIEKDRRKINLNDIEKFNIPKGPLLGKLQNGKTIKLHGKIIKPDDVSDITKGRKISYIADTVPCKNALLLAEESDLLVCESCYHSDFAEKAEKYMHMTAKQAGEIANQTNSKKLVLTHFSQRYKNAEILEEDAKDVFDNVVAARDFMKIKL